ncbi:MAG: GNAT family N-acetyltransferase [Gemmatirosa sp.]|nr:GNAT family N-acetyltransferase [Gemmatirosa sp.]
MSVVVRPVTAADAGAVAALLAELGHATDAADVPARLALVAHDGGAALLATDAAGESLGFVSLARHAVIHAPGPVALITGLVVAAAARGRGVGRALVAAARAWAEAEGCVRLTVTSAEHRADAHAFYPACGMAYTGRRFTASLTTTGSRDAGHR